MTAGDRSRADSLLVAALAAGETIEAAAAKAHISEATVYRRLRDDGFRRQVDDARADLVTNAAAQLAATATKAVQTLAALLDGQSGAIRLGAAKAVIELGVRLRESVELEQRVTELEQATAHSRPRRVG